jgi:predicted MFS family arabinose efflux permease
VTAPGFRAVLVAAAAVSLATVSDSLIYLVLQRQVAFDPAKITLLFVGTPLCYFLLAGPCGVLADRVGPRRLFLAGHAALLLIYALLWQPVAHPLVVGLCLLLLGAYYAATDGILAAMASLALPPDARGTGLGLLATCTTAARGLGAVAFGALWTYQGSAPALAVFAVALVTGMALAMVQLTRLAPLESPGATR